MEGASVGCLWRGCRRNVGVVETEFGVHLVKLEKLTLGVSQGKSQVVTDVKKRGVDTTLAPRGDAWARRHELVSLVREPSSSTLTPLGLGGACVL